MTRKMTAARGAADVRLEIAAHLARRGEDNPAAGEVASGGMAHIASNVSQTSIVAPPDSTGQPFASAIAASRLSALMTL